MSQEWPRRRDVREMLLTIGKVLTKNAFFDIDGELLSRDEMEDKGYAVITSQDFDRDFLTEVRDLVRDGSCLANALLAIAGAEEAEEPLLETQVSYVPAIVPPPHIGDRQAFFAGVAAAQLPPPAEEHFSF